MLYKQSTSEVWSYEFQIAGKRFRGSTGHRDRKSAEKEARRIRVEKESAAPERRRQGVGPLLDLSAADIERATAAGTTPRHLKALESLWLLVLQHFGERADISKIGYEDVQRYISSRRSGGILGQTIVREVQCLKRGMQIAKRRGWMTSLPDEWPPIKRDPPNEKRKGKLHSIKILQQVLADISPEARDACTFALLTGLRFAELKRVRAQWVEPTPKGSDVPALLRLPAGSTKNRKERIVGLPIQALQIIKRRALQDPIFPQGGYRKTLSRACARLGYDQVVTLRDLRHTYATLSLQAGADPIATQAALGHSDLRTTQRYLTSTKERTLGVSAKVAELLKGKQ